MTEPPDPPRARGGAAARARHVLGRIRAEGPVEPFRRFLYRHGVRRRLGLLVRPRLEVFRARRPAPADLSGHVLGPDDVDDYLALRPDQTRAEIEARLAAGHVGLIVRRADRVVAHSWVGLGRVPIEDLACTMELAPDACCLYDDFVAPEHRQRNALRAVNPLRRGALVSRGIFWHVAVLLPENRLAFERVGRHRPVFVGAIGRTRLGPWRRFTLDLDRELVGSRPLPVRFVGDDGSAPRVRTVCGPLFLDRAHWATAHDAAPVFPGSAALDRTGLLRRRLVAVFDAEARIHGKGRIPVEAKVLERGDLDDYLALRPDQDAAEVERRWAAGQVCFVGRAYGGIVAASWLAPGGGALAELGCELRLAPEAAGVYDDFVAPRLRRWHVLDRVADLRSEHALASGWKRCVALIPPEVPGAWVRARRVGRPVVATLARAGVGPWARWRLRLEPGASRADLPFRVTAGGREITPR
jgi:hypothetical protein